MNKKWLIIPALTLGGCNFDSEQAAKPSPRCNIAEDTTYLIITRNKFRQKLEPFVNFKSDREKVEILTVDDLLKCDDSNEPSSTIDTIRSYLKDFVVNSPKLKNVLFVGRAYPLYVYEDDYSTTYPAVYSTSLRSDYEVPALYFPSPTRESVFMDGNEPRHNLVETDQFYADPFSDCADSQKDYLNMGIDKLADSESFKQYSNHASGCIAKYDFQHNLNVGRVPAETIDDLNHWMENAINREKTANPTHSMFKDAPCFRDPEKRIPGLPERKLAEGTHKINFHFCQDEDGGDIVDLANNDRADLISFFGHGIHTQIGEKYVLKDDYSEVFGNRGFDKPPIIYAHACYSTTSHVEDLSVGGRLVIAEKGAAAFAGYSTLQYDIRFPFYESVFLDGAVTPGEAVYDTKNNLCESGNPDLKQKENLLALNLLGDPSIRIYNPELKLSAPKTINYNEEAGLFVYEGRVESQYSEPVDTFYISRNYLETGETGEIFTVSQNNWTMFNKDVDPFFLDLYSNDDIYGENSTGKSTFTYFGAIKCDTDNYSCAGSKTEVYPPVAFKCGNFRKIDENVFAINLEYLNDNADEKEFIFYAFRGLKIPKSQNTFLPEKIELYSALAGELTAGTEATVEFELPEGFNDLPPTEEEKADYFYYPPRYFAAYREPGHVGNITSTCPLDTNIDNDPTLN